MEQSIIEEFCENFLPLTDELGANNTAILLKHSTVLDLPAGRNLIRYGLLCVDRFNQFSTPFGSRAILSIKS